MASYQYALILAPNPQVPVTVLKQHVYFRLSHIKKRVGESICPDKFLPALIHMA